MKVHPQLLERHHHFIQQQHLFFVATAPLSADGHVNVSPKGYDAFVVLDPKRVAYADLGGSGIETHAHAQENGRICIMFCGFEEVPLILRLYGRAQAHTYGTAPFAALRDHFPAITGPVRGIIEVQLTRVQDSCGWGVPYYTYRGDRERLRDHNAARTQEAFMERRFASNSTSIDGLPGLIKPS